MDKKLIEGLAEFGLSEYEAKAYVALATLGSSTVTEVSQICDVPRSNLYEVLEKLTQKGFVDVQRGRPVIFKAVEPMKVLDETERKTIEKIKGAKRKIIEDIHGLKKEKSQEVVPALVWGIRGFDSVLKKIKEIVGRSKKEILINIPDVSVLDPVYLDLEQARHRGVKIKISTQKSKAIDKYKKVAFLRIRKETHGTDILSDNSEVLVAPSFPVVAVWVDNTEMAMHVRDFLNLIWKDAEILK